MSQAIVREEDRNRFHDLFEKYGFTGTDAVTEEEIYQYIDAWITTSKPTKQLKGAWAKAELRQRICEVAIAELEDWAQENVTSSAQTGRASRLSLSASFRHDLLSRSIALWVGKETSLNPLVLRSAQAQFELSNSTFGSFATIEPRGAISWATALLHGLDFKDSSGVHHTWGARAVIPLSRSEKGNYWTEVNRVTLGVTHLVLSRAEPSVRNAVERALEEVAAAEYTVATPSSLPGLPPGWLLYENVRVVRALEELKGFEAALSPVGTTSGLQLLGGLRLGRGIWHEWEAPEAVFDAGDATAKLFAWEGTESAGPPLNQVAATGEARLNLANCVPPSGTLYLEGWKDNEKLSSSTVLLRTAAKARPLDRQSRGIVAYRDSLMALPLAGAPTAIVRGFIAPNDVEPIEARVRLDDFREVGSGFTTTEDLEVEENAVPAEAGVDLSKLPLPELLKLPCAVRGFHHFRLDTVPPDYPKYAPVNMECKDCHVALLHRRRAKGAQKSRVVSTPRRQVPLSPQFARRPDPKLPWDLWLDAACFLGSGTIATFEGLAASRDLDPWQARGILKDLSWLGHVDVELGPIHRPSCWSVAPPALAFTSEREAILSGFRNQPFLGDIVELIEGAGGVCDKEHLAKQPAIVRIRGLTPSEAVSALDVACDVHGRTITIVDNAAAKLAAFCAAAGSPFALLQPVTLGTDGSLRKYDVQHGRWRHVDAPSSPGAYSYSYAGTGYVVHSSQGTFGGPPELVKIAAARLEGIRLHAYLGEARTFISRLGCEPPGLLGRSLVACSGRLPSISNGMSHFHDVPPDVAATILAVLYNGDFPT
jgi:hypothetical protein